MINMIKSVFSLDNIICRRNLYIVSTNSKSLKQAVYLYYKFK